MGFIEDKADAEAYRSAIGAAKQKAVARSAHSAGLAAGSANGYEAGINDMLSKLVGMQNRADVVPARHLNDMSLAAYQEAMNNKQMYEAKEIPDGYGLAGQLINKGI